jgi:DNA-binding response OmpR family regulator
MLRTSASRILIVDDMADAADSYAMLFEMWGYAVQVCYDGASALTIARTYLPGIILLDIGMPGMDGFEVAQRLREQPELADTTIIGSTGHMSEAYRMRAREAGFDHYLLKPVDLDQLEALLCRDAPERPIVEMPTRPKRLQEAMS